MRGPLFNLISIGLPVGVALLGLLAFEMCPSSARMGVGILCALALAVASLLGVVAAVVALVRSEGWVWLSLLGLLVNLAVLTPLSQYFWPV